MAVIGNNDETTANATGFAWEHEINSVDTYVCEANQTLTELHFRTAASTAGGSISVGVYDITSGANSAPLVYQGTVSISGGAATYSLTGLSVDLSAYEGQTLAIAHAKPTNITQAHRIASGTEPQSSSTADSLVDPFSVNVSTGSRYYGVWAVTETAASNSAPVVNDQTFSVADSASNGTVIGTLVATDSDGTVDSYAISGSTLAIDSSGQITLADNAGIVAGTPITATATVTDNGGGTDTATVTVNVTNSGLSFSCYDADSSNAAITSETLSHVRVLDPADLSEVAAATSIATSSTGSAEIDTDSVTIGTDYLVIARRSNGDVCEPFSVTASDLAAS